MYKMCRKEGNTAPDLHVYNPDYRVNQNINIKQQIDYPCNANFVIFDTDFKALVCFFCLFVCLFVCLFELFFFSPSLFNPLICICFKINKLWAVKGTAIVQFYLYNSTLHCKTLQQYRQKQKPQQSDECCEQAQKLLFNRNKPLAEPGSGRRGHLIQINI